MTSGRKGAGLGRPGFEQWVGLVTGRKGAEFGRPGFEWWVGLVMPGSGRPGAGVAPHPAVYLPSTEDRQT